MAKTTMGRRPAHMAGKHDHGDRHQKLTVETAGTAWAFGDGAGPGMAAIPGQPREDSCAERADGKTPHGMERASSHVPGRCGARPSGEMGDFGKQ